MLNEFFKKQKNKKQNKTKKKIIKNWRIKQQMPSRAAVATRVSKNMNFYINGCTKRTNRISVLHF